MRRLRFLMAFLLLLPASLAWAEEDAVRTQDLLTGETGFEKPEAAERAAYGYDPTGMEYRQNRVEDFQVIFVETAPFAALLSFGLTALISYAAQSKVEMKGGYLAGAVAGTVILSGTVATVSVTGKPYPPPDLTAELPGTKTLALGVPLVRLSF